MEADPQNLIQLKRVIRREIKNINSETLIKTSDNMIKRVKLCLECEGKHFEHLLKHN